jgi:hypothetical protein
VKDCRRVPIKFSGYSLSFRGGHPHVRIELSDYLAFKAGMVDEASRLDRAGLEELFQSPRFVPYAPVRRQLWNVWREINRVRDAAGLERIGEDCLELRRRIVRPFGTLVDEESDLPSLQNELTELSTPQQLEARPPSSHRPATNEPSSQPEGTLIDTTVSSAGPPEPVEARDDRPSAAAQFPEAWTPAPSEQVPVETTTTLDLRLPEPIAGGGHEARPHTDQTPCPGDLGASGSNPRQEPVQPQRPRPPTRPR